MVRQRLDDGAAAGATPPLPRVHPAPVRHGDRRHEPRRRRLRCGRRRATVDAVVGRHIVHADLDQHREPGVRRVGQRVVQQRDAVARHHRRTEEETEPIEQGTGKLNPGLVSNEVDLLK